MCRNTATPLYLYVLLWHVFRWAVFSDCFCVFVGFCSCVFCLSIYIQIVLLLTNRSGFFLLSDFLRLRFNTWLSNTQGCPTPPASLPWLMALSTFNILKSDLCLSLYSVYYQCVTTVRSLSYFMTHNRWNVSVCECLCVLVLAWVWQVNPACSPVALAGNKCGLKLWHSSAWPVHMIFGVCVCVCLLVFTWPTVIPHFE